MFNWLNSKGYYQGIVFLVLMMFVSCTNDVMTKLVGQRLHPLEMMFFRFFFNLITLLPFMLVEGRETLKTKMLGFNIIRGVLGFIGFSLFIYSIVELKLVEVVTIFWTIPLFVLILASIYLREKVTLNRWIATLIGFIGLSAITLIGADYTLEFRAIFIVPIVAAFVFAVQDIMIKKMVSSENRLTMLFYFAAVTTTLGIIPAILVWQTPTCFELFMLFLIGAGGNLMQYLIFKAYNATDLSALSPFRYLEFCCTAAFGFVFFGEIPGMNVLIGAAILIPTTLYLTMNENKK